MQKLTEPYLIKFPNLLTNQKAKKIFACSNRSYAIFQDFVITWGQTVYKNQDAQENSQQNQGQSDQQYENHQSKHPAGMQLIPIRVNDLALGTSHTFAYSKSLQLNESQTIIQQSRVYCWGSNQNYELGMQAQKYYSLLQVDLFDQAFEAGLFLNQISCGQSHTLAVFKDQESRQTKMFGWGQSKSCQLALDTTGIVPYPVDIECEFSSPILSIQSKSDYNIAVLQDGQIYSWGSNMFNRLGLNHLKPQKTSLNTSRQMASVSQESNRQDAITERKIAGLQNLISKIQKVKVPRKIQIFNRKIASLSLGTYHVIALSSQGQCFSWGNGINGQLGNNKFAQCEPQTISTKHLIDNPKFVLCCAGQQHSCVLDQKGNVYTCGSNMYGVLGHKKHENQSKKKRCKLFEKIEYFQDRNMQIKHITTGNRHIFVQTINSQIYGWGSNQFSQILLDEKQLGSKIAFKNQTQIMNNLTIQDTEENSQILDHKQIQDYAALEDYRQQNIEKKQIKEDKSAGRVSFAQRLLKNGEQVENQKKYSRLGNDKLIANTNINIVKKIQVWKSHYKEFLTRKRKQQDELLKQLDSILQDHIQDQ